jgi:SAM-dependent methyltransferase
VQRHPLDYSNTDYAYIERPNPALVALFESRVLAKIRSPRVLDIGAGAGANARALRKLAPAAHITAIEPNARARELLGEVCDETLGGDCEAWLARPGSERFDVLILSDVVEHIANPIQLLSALVLDARVQGATFLISVPNYAVWYNRVRTLAGRFEYQASGLYDRTHLRFYTQGSIRRLLEYVGLEVVEQRATPSLVQSLAPLLRRGFASSVGAGEHLALERSPLYRAYHRFIEPAESRLCELWPALLGFQIVSAARLAAR